MPNFKSQMTKIAALEANVDAARAALETAQRNFDDAQRKSRHYREHVAKILQKDWEAALATIPDAIVIGSQRENVKISCTANDCSISIKAWDSSPVFCFWAPGVFAWYTPEQISTVIEMFKAAIERGDTEFRFPPVAELNRTE